MTETTHERPARARRRGNRILWIVSGIVALALLAVAGTWAYLRFTGHDMTGLQGVWRQENDTDKRQGYDFQPDGSVSAWNGKEKSWWNTIGWEATWRREGDTITVKTDRAWNFVGKLEGDTIRGTMTMWDPSGRTPDVNTVDLVWKRD